MDKHRFNVGDVITSSKNKKIKYLIKEVGVKNELGELDYVVEDVTENSPFNGRTHKMTISKIDTWGVLLKENENVPRFKVGDCVVNKFGDVWHIDSFDNKNYQVSNGNEYNYFPISKQNEMHLWTIQDAKDGDVLFQDLMGGKTFIYNGVNPNTAILYSFIISNDGEDVLPYHIGKPNTGIGNIEENKNIIHPATKEQRYLLFQKMKEAGYKWDDKKKELKKIEEKSAWTEEDEKFFKTALWHISYSITNGENTDCKCDTTEWLKHLKERIKGG